jgi:hypothetical protein
MDVTNESPAESKQEARRAFVRLWNYDFFWSTLIGRGELGRFSTNMGHAEYAVDGSDRDEDVHALYDDPEDVLAFDPVDALGKKERSELSARFTEHYRANCAANPTGVNMTGTYITVISGLLQLFGWDMLLLAAGTDPRRFGTLTNRYGDWMLQYYEAMAECEAPLIMVHDDMVWTSGPFIAPAWYRQYVFPNFKRYFRPLKEAGKKIVFTSDGDYTMFIDDLVECGVDGFVLEPMTDLAYLAERYGKTHFFIGNADTRILLSGSKEQIRAEVERCMHIGKPYPGFFLAVGNHIPANTPVESCLYYNQCYEEMMMR